MKFEIKQSDSKNTFVSTFNGPVLSLLENYEQRYEGYTINWKSLRDSRKAECKEIVVSEDGVSHTVVFEGNVVYEEFPASKTHDLFEEYHSWMPHELRETKPLYFRNPIYIIGKNGRKKKILLPDARWFADFGSQGKRNPALNEIKWDKIRDKGI